MTERQSITAQGAIHYWSNDIRVRRFEPTHNVVVWDVVNSDFVNHAIAIICSGYD